MAAHLKLSPADDVSAASGYNVEAMPLHGFTPLHAEAIVYRYLKEAEHDRATAAGAAAAEGQESQQQACSARAASNRRAISSHR